MSLRPTPDKKVVIRSALLGLVPLALLAYLIVFERNVASSDHFAKLLLAVGIFAAVVGTGCFIAFFLRGRRRNNAENPMK
jgi:uncharacterized membrane protein YbhN (UPF0104 family)